MSLDIYQHISIEEPCSENWDGMTPQEAGRHCAKCDKVVVDFSQEDRKGVLRKMRENMSAGVQLCGRFRKDQVLGDVRYFYTQRNGLGFLRRFTAALLLVMGPFLFVGCQDQSPDPSAQVVASTTEEPKDTLEPKVKDTIALAPPILVAPQRPLEKIVKEPVVHVAGGISFSEEFYVLDEVETVETVESVVMGAMVRTEYVDATLEAIPIPDTLEEEEEDILPLNSLALKVYPNPTDDIFTLRIDNPAGEECTVMLFDINGRHLRNLKTESLPGVSEHQYSLGEYPPGMYLVTVVTATDRITSKVVKN